MRDACHHDLWSRHAVLDALLQQRDGLVHEGRERLQALDEVLVVVGVLEAQRAGERTQCLDAAQLIQGHEVRLEVVRLQPHLVPVLEQVVADPVLAREPAAVDGGQVLQSLLVLRVLAGQGGQAHVRP